MYGVALVGISAAWLTGCTGEPDVENVTANDGAAAVDAPPVGTIGWVAEVAQQPAAFAELMKDPKAKAGWVAMQAHAYRQALDHFADDPVGRARAELQLGILYQDLNRLSGIVNEQLFTTWSARGGLPEGSDAPLVAALAANCSGGETAAGWARQITAGPDQGLAMAVAQGRDPFDVSTSGPYGRRMALHRQVRSSGDPAALFTAAIEPMVIIPETAFDRRFWDPCVYRTLADLWLDRAVRDAILNTGPTDVRPVQPIGERWRNLGRLSLSDAGLGSRLLAPWPTTADLKADLETAESPGLLGVHAPSLRRLGIGTATYPADDPEGAKDEVRILDSGLDGVTKQLGDSATEGYAIVSDLRLVQRFRQEWLIARARQALLAQHPRRALVYLELARDVGGRVIGPENGPSLFALTAEARLRLGYTREALDALHVLVGGHAETVGLVEAAGDLAVLQGIDRQGDSKEE